MLAVSPAVVGLVVLTTVDGAAAVVAGAALFEPVEHAVSRATIEPAATIMRIHIGQSTIHLAERRIRGELMFATR